MADKVALVRLRAQNDNYDRAMEQSRKKTEQLAETAPKIEALGAKFEAVGDKLTRRVTLPLVGLSIAGVKVASDFETTFARMVGLAGVPADEIDRLRDSVLQLAQDTGRGPQELAEALYEAASAGLDAEQALAAVTVAAQASAAGMGSTVDIVGLVASAIAAYGAEAINAAEATDILVATIRAGRANPEELAGTLGRVLPIAAQLGVTFDEVGGTVAYLSNVFGDTNRTVTALSGFLVKLVSPTQQGREALEDMGTSVEELQRAVDRDGLLGALELLRDHGFADNQQALRALFDDIEGFQAALALLNDNSGTLDATLTEVANSTGALQQAFQNWLGTDSAETAKSFQEISVALINFGGKIAPLVADLTNMAGTIAGIVDVFPDWLVQWGLLAAILAGPTTKATGFVLKHLDDIGRIGAKAFEKVALGAYDAAGNISTLSLVAGVATAAIAGIAMAWADAAAEAAEAEARVQGYTDAIREAGDVVEGVTNRLRDMAEAGDISTDTLRLMADAGVNIDELAAAAAGGGDAMDELRRRMILAFVADNIDPDLERDIRSVGFTVEQFVDHVLRGDDVWGRFVGSGTERARSFAREILVMDDELTTMNEEVLTAADRAGLLAQVVGDVDNEAAGAAGAVSQFGDEAAASAQQVAQLTQAVDEVFDAMFGSAIQAAELDSLFEDFNDTFERTSSSGGRAARSIDAVAEKQKALERATQDAERANEQWQRSVEAVERANRELADAQAELDALLRGPSARDKAEALNQQRREELGLEEARVRLAEAQEALAEAEASSDPEEIAAARRNLARAELDLESQTWRLEDATAAYNAIANWSAETDTKVRDARDRVTEAQKRLDQATAESAKRMAELQAAEQAAAAVAAASPASFAQAEVGVSRVRDRANEARDAFLSLASGIQQAISKIVAMDITAARKVEQIDDIIARIMANPFLNQEQRNQLLLFAWASKASIISSTPSLIRHPFELFDTGGVVPGPVGKPVPVIAHAGETILPTHKRPFESLVAAGAAGFTAPAADRGRGDFIIQYATFGTEGAVADLDWWWRTKGAGV